MSNEWSSTTPATPGWYVVIDTEGDHVPRIAAMRLSDLKLELHDVGASKIDLERKTLLWHRIPPTAGEGTATGLPDRTPRQLTETVRALENRTDTLTSLVRDLTRRLKALEARPRVSPKRKARATKGGAP